MDDYQNCDATALAECIANGTTTAEVLLNTALARVEAVNSDINAAVMLAPDVARRKIAEGLPDGPLKGVPFLLKDLGAQAVDFPSHNGSRLFRDTTYPVNSTLFDRLAAAGLNTFGRTTSPEGGIGVVTQAAVYGGPTRNPWNLNHTPGGSSGGAAAVVAAGVVPAAHGSDGGGSIRVPASCCGLFGFKATRGRLPKGPYAGESWAGMSIDGFLTRSVRDTALLLDITQGADIGAPYFAPPLKDSFQTALRKPPRPLRIALCDTSLTGAPIDPECRTAVHDAAKLLSDMGHSVEPGMPQADTIGMMDAWTAIAACGTALNIRLKVQARGVPLQEGEIEGVARGAVSYASTISGDRYLECVGKIHSYGRELASFFQTFDIFLTPTLAEPPATIGRFNHETENYVEYRTGPEGVFAYSPYAAAFNASGQPAASVPLFWSSKGLPIGIHFAARFGEDELLMSLCADLERARPWFNRRPPVA
jgi:amidase